MNFRRKKYTHAEVQAGALSDILFFLMLFFLIISTLASPSAVKLLLPQAKTPKDMPTTPQKLEVSITADLQYKIGDEDVTLQNFEQVLSLKTRGAEKTTIIMRVDRTISVNEMMKILDIINKLKLPVVMAVDKNTN